MNEQVILAVLASLPWIALPMLLLKRLFHSTSLDQESAEIAPDAPWVSIVIPARNEEDNIARCVRSMLSSTYPSFDILVVDDGSTDATREIVDGISREDERVKLLDAPPVPPGWFGGQWAMFNGARATRGVIICFADADTWHEPEFLARAVNAMTRRAADLFSPALHQVLRSAWELIVQPQVLVLAGARYGGTEHITDSAREENKFASGPCIFVRREAYERVGGHELVRGYIATDVMLARGFFRNGLKVVFASAGSQGSVRMYRSLRELVNGWSKNIVLGSRIAAGNPDARDFVKNLLQLLLPIFQIAPTIALVAALMSGDVALSTWATLSSLFLLGFWIVFYRILGEKVWPAFAFPAGAALLLFILMRSLARGRRVTWKDREYVSR